MAMRGNRRNVAPGDAVEGTQHPHMRRSLALTAIENYFREGFLKLEHSR